jgi:hypothetical protein
VKSSSYGSRKRYSNHTHVRNKCGSSSAFTTSHLKNYALCHPRECLNTGLVFFRIILARLDHQRCLVTNVYPQAFLIVPIPLCTRRQERHPRAGPVTA